MVHGTLDLRREVCTYAEVLEETLGLLGGVLSGRHVDLLWWTKRREESICKLL
jgi:hypothetical protein